MVVLCSLVSQISVRLCWSFGTQELIKTVSLYAGNWEWDARSDLIRNNQTYSLASNAIICNKMVSFSVLWDNNKDYNYAFMFAQALQFDFLRNMPPCFFFDSAASSSPLIRAPYGSRLNYLLQAEPCRARGCFVDKLYFSLLRFKARSCQVSLEESVITSLAQEQPTRVDVVW